MWIRILYERFVWTAFVKGPRPEGETAIKRVHSEVLQCFTKILDGSKELSRKFKMFEIYLILVKFQIVRDPPNRTLHKLPVSNTLAATTQTSTYLCSRTIAEMQEAVDELSWRIPDAGRQYPVSIQLTSRHLYPALCRDPCPSLSQIHPRVFVDATEQNPDPAAK